MKSKKLSDLLFKAKPHFRTLKEELAMPQKIGHILAVECYEGTEHMETLFVEHIDVCNSHTAVHFSRNYFEIYPFKAEAKIVLPTKVRIYYENNTSFEITRL